MGEEVRHALCQFLSLDAPDILVWFQPPCYCGLSDDVFLVLLYLIKSCV